MERLFEMVMSSIILYVSLLRDYVYSLWFCLKVLPFSDAIKTPINISHRVKVGSIRKGAIVLNGPIYHNRVFIGHRGFSAIADGEGLIHIEPDGMLIINGTASFAQGIRLWIDQNASITVGDHFSCNKNCLFRSFDDITIGKDVLMGWDIELNTSDGHLLQVDNVVKTNHGPIIIGNHVWVASHVVFSKNSSVADGSVVAQRSLIATKHEIPNVLLAGTPARKVKDNIEWQE